MQYLAILYDTNEEENTCVVSSMVIVDHDRMEELINEHIEAKESLKVYELEHLIAEVMPPSMAVIYQDRRPRPALVVPEPATIEDCGHDISWLTHAGGAYYVCTQCLGDAATKATLEELNEELKVEEIRKKVDLLNAAHRDWKPGKEDKIVPILTNEEKKGFPILMICGHPLYKLTESEDGLIRCAECNTVYDRPYKFTKDLNEE